MATFSPDIGGIPASRELIPDQTGSSHGVAPNKTFEALFQGVGTAIKGAADFMTGTTEYNINQDAHTIYDEANKPYDPSNIPQSLQTAAGGMGALQTAYNQGKITDTYYYGQLAASSKALRAAYPGFENYVDATIQKVTGVNPANAYRQSIIADISANSALGKNAADRQAAWENTNGKDIVQLFPDYFQNPGKYDYDAVRTQVFGLQANQAQVAAESANLDLAAKQGTATDKSAGQAATTALNFTVNSVMSGLNNQIGFNSKTFMQDIAKYQTQGFSPEEYNNLTSQLATSRASMYNALIKQMNQPLSDGSTNSYASILGPTATKQYIDQAMQPFDQVAGLVTDKNFGLAAYYVNLNANRTDRDLNTLVTGDSSGQLAVTQALTKVNPALGANYINSTGGWTGVYANAAPELAAKVATGEDTFNKSVTRMMATNGSDGDKAQGVNAVIDTNLQTITSGNATPDQVSNTVKSVYTLDDKGHDIFNTVQPNEHLQLYTRLFNPSVTKAILRNGNTQDMQEYFSAAIDRVSSIPEFSRAAAAVQGVSDWQRGLNIQYNPDLQKITVTPNTGFLDAQGVGGGFTGTMVQRQVNKQALQAATNAADTLNTVFGTIGPMLDGMKVPADKRGEVYGQILKNLNVNLNAGHKDGLFDVIGQKLSSMLNSINESTSQVDPNKGMALAVNSKGGAKSNDEDGNAVVNPAEAPDATAGMKNNNPGNIKFSSTINWQGQTGPSSNTDQGVPQAKFDSVQSGMRALGKNLLTKYHNDADTIQDLIAGANGWTPGYQPAANNIAKTMGVSPTEHLNLSDPKVLQEVMKALILQEHGKASAHYTDAMIEAGAKAALA